MCSPFLQREHRIRAIGSALVLQLVLMAALILAAPSRAAQRSPETHGDDAGNTYDLWWDDHSPEPDAPTGVQAITGSESGQLILKWNASPDADGYWIFYDEDADNPPFWPNQNGHPPSGADVGDVTQATLTGLTPGQRYYCAVKAYNFFGESGYSAQASVPAGSLEREALTLSVDPEGAGTISAVPVPDPDGKYAFGTVVTLTARPETDYVFLAWSGDLTGRANPAQVAMYKSKNVKARFTTPDNPEVFYNIAYTGVVGHKTVTPAGVFISGPGANGTLNIRKVPGRPEYPIIAAVETSGTFARVYTEAEIQSLKAPGKLLSVTAKNCHIEDVVTSVAGQINMTARPNSTRFSNPAFAYTTIRSFAPSNTRVKVNLSGVILRNLSASDQTVASIVVSTKKYQPAGQDQYLSYGAIGQDAAIGADGGGPASAVILAPVIRRIEVTGGQIRTGSILARQASLFDSKIITHGVLFTLNTSEGKDYVPRQADLHSDFLYSSARTLILQALGGDLRGEEIVAERKIVAIAARYQRYVISGADSPLFIGGMLGRSSLAGVQDLAAAPPGLLVVSGASGSDLYASIGSVRGDLGVYGAFYAGATVTGEDIQPNCKGTIRSIATAAPSHDLPITPPGPFMVGTAEIAAGTTPLFKNGDHAGFSPLHCE